MSDWPPVLLDDDTPQQRMTLIRERIRLYSRDLALEHLLTAPSDDWLRVESFQAAIGVGLQCAATRDEIIMAANAEWQDAIGCGARFIEALRRRLWRMCKAREPEQVIITAADAVLFQWKLFVPAEILNPLLNRIWVAAAPRRMGHVKAAR